MRACVRYNLQDVIANPTVSESAFAVMSEAISINNLLRNTSATALRTIRILLLGISDVDFMLGCLGFTG